VGTRNYFLGKFGVIRIVPNDGMNSTHHDPSIVVKSHNSLLPTERSAQANFEENSPKSPQNSNEDSSELRQFLEIQNTILESTQHSAPNHININYVNKGKNSDQDSDQVIGAQLNELTNANTHIPFPEGGVITSTTSQQISSMNRLNTPSKAAVKSVMSMDHTANNPQGGEQSAGGNKNADNNIEVSSTCTNQSNLANTHNAGKVFVEIPISNERSTHQTAGKRDTSDHNQMPKNIDGAQKRQENGKNYTSKVNHNATGKAAY